MTTPGSTTVSGSDTSHSSPAPKPERISATVMALLVIGFSTWVLLTIPLQPAFILSCAPST
jgi:hypothetical protein